LTSFFRVVALLFALVLGSMLAACGGLTPGLPTRAVQPLPVSVVDKMTAMGSGPQEGTLIRIFKESSQLEVWKQTRSGGYKLFNTYEICAWSGGLGPKVVEGDRQSPEGFYNITPALLNPNSNYYLAFNTGYPNKFDRANGRTGSLLMVHGDCSSRGCYSMTDEAIAEIYAIVRETFKGGNKVVQLQIYPFRMTPQNLARHTDSPHYAFWQNIKEGYDRFEISRREPAWDVCEKRYTFDVDNGSGLDAAGVCPGRRPDDVLVAELAKRQASDSAAVETEVAALAMKAAKDQAAAEKEAEILAARKASGEAISSFVSGLFGGDKTDAEKVMYPDLVAPIPAPRIQRG
jgi:murein L,D-transpeptidase YafK